MQVLIHKAPLVELDIDPTSSGLSLDDESRLHLEDSGKISVYVLQPPRWPLGFGKTRTVKVGSLGEKATRLLKPALDRNAHLRVRIVEIQPAHLSPKGQSSLSISVWGNPGDLAPLESAQGSSVAHPIKETSFDHETE